MGTWDSLRARAHRRLEKLPGGVADRLRGLNEALGRPLASADELEDRRAFEQGVASPVTPGAAVNAAASAAAKGSAEAGKAAPVIIYHLDKHRTQLPRLTQTLDGADVPYRILNLEGDQATQEAVRRDADGRKLPLVFIAGECVGGRDELHAMEKSGELKRKVWG